MRRTTYQTLSLSVCLYTCLSVSLTQTHTHGATYFHIIARDTNQLLSLWVSTERQKDCQHPYLTDRDREREILIEQEKQTDRVSYIQYFRYAFLCFNPEGIIRLRFLLGKMERVGKRNDERSNMKYEYRALPRKHT